MNAFDGMFDMLTDLRGQRVEIGSMQPVRVAGKPDAEGAFTPRITVSGSVQPASSQRTMQVQQSGIQLKSALYTAFVPFTVINDGEVIRVDDELYTLVSPPSPLGTAGQGSHLELDVIRRRGNG